MSLDWILKLLAEIGGSTIVILGLLKFFGEAWTKKFIETIKSKLEKEVSAYQNQLDILKTITLRYSDKQFELYSNLWTAIYELKLHADDLWQDVSKPNLLKFSKKLHEAKRQVGINSIFFETEHYNELTELIKYFSEYEIGKERLMNLRQEFPYYVQDGQILINNNRDKKDQFDRLVEQIKIDFRNQLRGVQD